MKEGHASLTQSSDGEGGMSGPGGSIANADAILGQRAAAFTKASDLLKNDVIPIVGTGNSVKPECIDLTEDSETEGSLNTKCSVLPQPACGPQHGECVDLTGSLSLQFNNGFSAPQTIPVKAFTTVETSASSPLCTLISSTAAATSTRVNTGCKTVSESRVEGGFVSAGSLLKGKGKMASSSTANSAAIPKMKPMSTAAASLGEPHQM